MKRLHFDVPEKATATPILSSITNKDYIKLKELLESENKQPSSATIPNFTPLHFAAEIGDAKAVEILIQYGADINAQYVEQQSIPDSSDDQTTLKVDQTKMEKQNLSDNNRFTPLKLAMMNREYDVVVILLRAGALLDHINQKERRDALLFAIRIFYDELFELLLPHIDKLDELDELGVNLMYRVVAKNRHRQLQLLLQQGADPNIKGCLNFFDYLPDHPHTKYEYGTILHVTTTDYENKLFMYSNVRKLIPFKYEEKIKNILKIFKTLLCYGANPNYCNTGGCTVLEYVAKVKTLNSSSYKFSTFEDVLNEDMIEWLLMYGAEWKSTRIDFFKEERSRAGTIIVEYNVKRKLAGLKYQDDVLNEGKDLLKEDFIKECTAELDKMKKWLLFEDMTMYRFLRCSSKRSLVSLLSREEVKKIYNQDLFLIEFPIYKNLIERNFMEGEEYESVYNSAYEDLYNFCGKCLPNVVLDKIMDYIDRKDMININKAKNRT